MRFIFCALLLVGCGGPSLTGVYTGSETGKQGSDYFSADVTVSLEQDGDKISGTWQSSTGASGTLTGSTEQNPYIIEPLNIVVAAGQSCAGTFSGTGVLVDDESPPLLRASITGSSSCGMLEASFELRKK
jgi:hypothetical protein